MSACLPAQGYRSRMAIKRLMHRDRLHPEPEGPSSAADAWSAAFKRGLQRSELQDN